MKPALQISGSIKVQMVKGVTKKGIAEALQSGGELLLQKANVDVPFDEGTLEGSGDVTKDVDQRIAAVSYSTPYAAYLHEHPEFNFQHGRKGKWLEDAARNNRSDIAELMAEVMKKHLT